MFVCVCVCCKSVLSSHVSESCCFLFLCGWATFSAYWCTCLSFLNSVFVCCSQGGGGGGGKKGKGGKGKKKSSSSAGGATQKKQTLSLSNAVQRGTHRNPLPFDIYPIQLVCSTHSNLQTENAAFQMSTLASLPTAVTPLQHLEVRAVLSFMKLERHFLLTLCIAFYGLSDAYIRTNLLKCCLQ